MLKDMTKSFGEAVEQNKNIILDNYTLKQGLYIRANINKPLKNIDEKEYIIITKEDDISKIDIKKWFLIRDYYSVILNDDTNKAIDLPDKKIHSTNYLTLFIKKDKFPFMSKDSISTSLLKERIENYYNVLEKAEDKFIEMLGEKKKTTKAEKEVYLQEYFNEDISYIRSTERIENIKKYKEYMLDNLDEFIEFIKDFSKEHEFSNYIKVFFEADESIYEKESGVYITPRIFNVNDYNLLTDGKIIGLPSNDMTTNSKKPYLILKTMKCSIPDRLSVKETKTTKSFYEWLKRQNRLHMQEEIRLEYEYDFKGSEPYRNQSSYFNIHMNRENQIEDFDNIPFALPKLNFNLDNILKIYDWSDDKASKNYLPKLISDEAIGDFSVLESRVSEYFFNNRMKGYYKNADPGIKSNDFTGTLKVLFLESKDAFYDYFHKGVELSICSIIDKISTQAIEEQLKHIIKGLFLNRVQRAYNLRISFLKYFNIKGGKEVADSILKIMDSLKIKLYSTQTVICESDEEFYFTAGQLAYYILYQSKAANKNFGIFEPFLMAKNSQQLKRKLDEMFAAYKHAIKIDSIKFKNAMSMVMGYEADKQIKDKMKDMLLAGILSNNIFLSKKEEAK